MAAKRIWQICLGGGWGGVRLTSAQDVRDITHRVGQAGVVGEREGDENEPHHPADEQQQPGPRPLPGGRSPRLGWTPRDAATARRNVVVQTCPQVANVAAEKAKAATAEYQDNYRRQC
jgi:hypothetical protein